MAKDHGHADADTFDIRASLRSIGDAANNNRMLVALTCLFTLALTALYIHVWPATYTVEAKIMSEPDYDYQRDTFYTGWYIFRKDEARTELELVASGPVLAEVVNREKLTYDDVYHPFVAQVSLFWERSWVGKNYRKLKQAIFSSEEDPGGPTPEQMEFGRTVAGLASGVELSPVGESNVGRLTVKGPTRDAYKVANTLIDVYLAGRVDRHKAEAQSSYDLLKEQVAKASEEMKELSDERVNFSERHKLMFDFQKEGLEVSKLTQLETGIADARVKIASEEASLREINKQLETEPAVKTVSTVSELNVLRENTKLKRLEAQINLLQSRSRFSEQSPEVREGVRELEKLDALAAELSEKVEKVTTEGLNMVRQDLLAKRSALQADLEGARAGLAVMDQTRADMQARLRSVPGLQNELQDMDRDLAAASEKYKQLLVKQGQAEVSLATSGGTIQSVRVVEYAAMPGDKTWPKPKYLYPGGLLLGLIAGIGLALLKSHASGRILREHVEHGRGAVPLYGTIAVAARGRPNFGIARDSMAQAASSSKGAST
jgi:uncharacterized protein involved in exopolysaccharide biosynthesis